MMREGRGNYLTNLEANSERFPALLEILPVNEGTRCLILTEVLTCSVKGCERLN